MDEIKIIEVKQSVFADNDHDAERLRQSLKRSKTFLLNLMSSPGSGKTSVLLALAKVFASRGIMTLDEPASIVRPSLRMRVMEADIDSSVDAQTMKDAGIETIQIHTGGMCHLDADMTRQGLEELGYKDFDLVILENVGNLVCPAEFDTGAVRNMTILSVPEGHDKPLKYPLMYETCDLLVVNKTDVLPYFDFDCEKVVEYAKLRNPFIEILFVSAKTGEGMEALADWIEKETRAWIG